MFVKFLRHHSFLGYQLFISYRRGDVGEKTAQLIHRELRKHFGHVVFLDLEEIQAGPFPQSLQNALAQSRVIVALIGTSWSTIADEQTKRRLDRPDDWVRQEIACGLTPGIGKKVFPVYLDGARELKQADFEGQQALPLCLGGLVNCQAENWGKTIQQLQQGVRSLVRRIRGDVIPPEVRQWRSVAALLLGMFLVAVAGWFLFPRVPSIPRKAPPPDFSTTFEDGFTSPFFGNEEEDSTAADWVRYLKAEMTCQINKLIKEPCDGQPGVEFRKDHAVVKYILSSEFSDPYRPFVVDVKFGKGGPFVSLGFLVRESSKGKVIFPLHRAEEIFPNKDHCTFHVPASLKGDRIVVILAMRDSDFDNFAGDGGRFKMSTVP